MARPAGSAVVTAALTRPYRSGVLPLRRIIPHCRHWWPACWAPSPPWRGAGADDAWRAGDAVGVCVCLHRRWGLFRAHCGWAAVRARPVHCSPPGPLLPRASDGFVVGALCVGASWPSQCERRSFFRVALLASCGNRRFRDGCDAGNGCRGQPFMCRRRRCRHPCCRLPWCGRAVGRGRVTVIWRPPPHRQVSGGQPPDCSPHDIIPLELSSPTLFYRPSWRRWFPHALCVARQPGSGTAGWGKIQPRVAVWAFGRSRRVLGCPSGPSGLCPVRVCSAGGGVSLGDVGRGQATFGSGVAGKRVSPVGHALARRVRKGGGRSRVSSV